MYHERSRELQERFDSRRIADRLAAVLLRQEFTEEDRAFVSRQRFFFLATADAEGRPDCSYKGGASGFVRIVPPATLVFPSYDGNGMFRSLGNILANSAVGLLFIDFEAQQRLRVNGRATLHLEDELKSSWPGAQGVVRVKAQQIFPNCPRYIHRMALVESSEYVPEAGRPAPVPGWKRNPAFKDYLPQEG